MSHADTYVRAMIGSSQVNFMRNSPRRSAFSLVWQKCHSFQKNHFI